MNHEWTTIPLSEWDSEKVSCWKWWINLSLLCWFSLLSFFRGFFERSWFVQHGRSIPILNQPLSNVFPTKRMARPEASRTDPLSWEQVAVLHGHCDSVGNPATGTCEISDCYPALVQWTITGEVDVYLLRWWRWSRFDDDLWYSLLVLLIFLCHWPLLINAHQCTINHYANSWMALAEKDKNY